MALRNSISDEKDVEAIASHLDHANTAATNGGLSAEDMEFVANFPEEKKKKRVLAKIDGWLLPRRYPHHLEMVPPPRDPNSSRDSIYIRRHRRCFLWPLRIRDRQNGWYWWPGRLEMDLLHRRNFHNCHVLRHMVLSYRFTYSLILAHRRRVTNSGEYREKTFDKGALFSVIKDWKAYLLIIMSWSNAAPNYGLKFSMPSIVKGMGFTSSNAQLMTIPPYLCGSISSYLLARFADKHKRRMPFIVGPQLCIIIAFSILMTKAEFIVQNLRVCYFAVYLACAGMYPILPNTSAWNINNNLNPTKRAISIGYVTCAGTIGGIYGSYIYIDKEKPKYTTGYGASLGFTVAGILAAVTLKTALNMINKKRSKLSEPEIRNKYTEDELEAMGEKSPLYQYKL